MSRGPDDDCMSWVGYPVRREADGDESTSTFGGKYTCQTETRSHELLTHGCEQGHPCTVAKIGRFLAESMLDSGERPVDTISTCAYLRRGGTLDDENPDGRLRGSWTTGGGLGTEMLTPK